MIMEMENEIYVKKMQMKITWGMETNHKYFLEQWSYILKK